jgi:hypothetical protein
MPDARLVEHLDLVEEGEGVQVQRQLIDDHVLLDLLVGVAVRMVAELGEFFTFK